MNFMLALNVTIYGLGIVFLALLVLMVAIMLLSKIFSMATGKDVLEVRIPAAPAAAPLPDTATTAPAAVVSAMAETSEPVIAPLPGKVLSVAVRAGNHVRRGDELCVIEAMKMGNSVKAPRDGVVVEVRVAPGDTVSFGAPLVLLASTMAAVAPRPASPSIAAPLSPAVPAGPTGLTLTVGGAAHAAEVTVAAAGATAVQVDGSSYRVQRDPNNGNTLFVNGQPHTVEVKEMAGTSMTVLVDGMSQRIEIARRAPAAAVSLSLTHAGKAHKVEVRSVGAGASSVLVDGSSYQVEQDRSERSRILVNGQAHTVEVKEMAGASATVLIDGRVEPLEVAREAAASPVPAPAPVAAAGAPPRSSASGAGERVTAPLPGKILSVAVKVGDRVHKGDELCVIEAMKMGNSIRAQRDATIGQILVAPGQTVAFGAPLLVLD